MESWFNTHGVGKQGIDNGIAIFVFPDNTVFGMIGGTHDCIAVPYLTTFGGRAISGIEDDSVVAVLNLVSAISEKTGETVVTEEKEDGFLIRNFDIIRWWVVLFALVFFLYQQRDGFQWEDVKWSVAVLAAAFIILGASIALSETSSDMTREYGMITATTHGQYPYQTQTRHQVGDTVWYTYENHIMYTNKATITSYDFKDYTHVFESSDYPSCWNRKEGEYYQLNINTRTDDLYWTEKIDDYSGGQTRRAGTWINPKNTIN